MAVSRERPGRYGLFFVAVMSILIALPLSGRAAPYAAMVMDARTGDVLHARSADKRLHPASLTKMMTLYIAFEAVQNGEISMDTVVTVSRFAASEPPSALGLKAGQRIKLRYLVRAAAVRSANDASTAIAEAISGSEAAFARRMNRTAKALGMTRTTFKNAHGLTQEGHMSTARDMTILGRHVLYDYPMYYNLFARQSTHAGIKTVYHTNRKFLRAYQGADGIKTGYTRAAGFNLTASAQRGQERIIATIFGGNSTASRNAKMAELMDLGFSRAPSHAEIRYPAKPPYVGQQPDVQIAHGANPSSGTRAKSVRVARAAVTRSLRPQMRSLGGPDPIAIAEADRLIVESLEAEVASTVPDVTAPAENAPDGTAIAALPSIAPTPPPPPATPAQDEEIVSRLSTSGGRQWGINLGRYATQFSAEKVLLRTALSETTTLDGALRKVVNGSQGWEATFQGMTRDTAELACRRLQARQVTCFMMGPPS